MTAQNSAAPPVVAVLVAHDPGDWFAAALDALAGQDYPQLATLVVDTGERDVTADVEAHLPGAAVVRAPEANGYGAAANRVRGTVEGAAFYLFLHDDVALEPDAVTKLVEEAFRSNAAIAGPKLVNWHNSRRIRSVGATIDPVGGLSPYAEPDEMDQEQHDRVRDVFLVTSGATLVRSDLFESIGGFDETITFYGDNLDLCWRAQLAGARVVIVPDAVARHVESFPTRRGEDSTRRLLARHRLRSTLKCYGWVHLLWVLPFAFLLALLETVYSLIFGRFTQARDIAGAWLWNAARLPGVLVERRRIKSYRRVRDGELARLQVRGSARLNSFLRGQIGGDARLQTLASKGREFTGTFRAGPRRTATIVWVLVGLVWLFGTRHLITRGIPVYGQFAAFPDASSALHGYWSGWNDAGLGRAGPGPFGLLLTGLAGTLSLGAMGLLRQILILGLMPLGWIGVWRLTGPIDSRRARLIAVAVYLSIPLPYNAIAGGRWDTLLLYATLPFLVLRVNRLIGITPFGPHGGPPGPGIPERSLLHQVVSLGLLMATVAAFEPLVIALVPGLALVLVAVSLLTGTATLSMRAVLLSVASAGVAALLHLPWLLQFTDLSDLITQLVGRPSEAAPRELHRLLRFESGPWGGHVLGWAPLVVASVALVLARGQRMVGAFRGWGIALAGFAGAWVTANGWRGEILTREFPIAELLLAPAAVGLAMAAANGFAAFEHDVPRFSFGWRQITLSVGVLALAATTGPMVFGATDGRWDAPTSDLVTSLRLIDDNDAGESYRVLWIGAPEVMPLDGWEIDGGMIVATSVRGFPDLRQQWAGPFDDRQQRLADAVELGVEGKTARLGRLLAPMGVQYVVVVQRGTPTFSDGVERPAAPAVVAAMTSQLDLRPIATDPSVLVFANSAYVSSRAQFETALPDVAELTDPVELVVTDLTDGIPVLTDRRSSTEQRGLMSDAPVLVAETMEPGWELRVGPLDGEDGPTEVVQPTEAFGWAMRFDPTTGGSAVLSYRRSSSVTWMLVAQGVLWLVVVRIAVAERGGRRFLRRRRAVEVES